MIHCRQRPTRKLCCGRELHVLWSLWCHSKIWCIEIYSGISWFSLR